ncbi:MAG: hypothetical protein IT430_02055 [Phycisphaerales bacterium]|nr:hypothetical protein [Phycisphaerales bacterium]
MSLKIMVLAGVVGVAGAAALGQPINIGDFSGNEQVITFTPGFGGQNAPFVYEGVEFSESGGGSGGAGFNGSINWGSYFDNIPGSSQGNGFNDQWGDSLIIMRPPAGIRRFGCLLSTTPVTTWTMNLYDASNNLLGFVTRTMPAQSDAVFLGYETSADIARVEIDETNGENGNITLMDDVRLEAVGGYRLSTTGQCPGTVTLRWSGATPSVQQGIVYGANQGSTTIPNGPCQGTMLGLQGGVQLVNIIGTGNGSGTANGQIGTGICNDFLQLVEAGSCNTSNVSQLP